MFAGRLWLDFAGENIPSGRKVEQLIYAVLSRPAPPEGSADAKVQLRLTDATDEALRGVDDRLRDPRRFPPSSTSCIVGDYQRWRSSCGRPMHSLGRGTWRQLSRSYPRRSSPCGP
jgi:hypothetical protein